MDFALILFVLCLLTGALWSYDKLVARRHRDKSQPDPWWVEYGASFFPVIAAVFLLRSFIAEPFRIPSGSMIPTLLVGDFILVNKFAYGIRLPVINRKIIDMNDPKRGEVVVFRYPHDPSQDYIKRVVGLPGDRVEYINKRLTINGEPVAVREIDRYLHPRQINYSQRYVETLGGVEHEMLNDRDAPPHSEPIPFAMRENCVYSGDGLSCTVPPGHYFMMGDNRDQSADSRVWGFVSDRNLVGKAFFVWFHADSILPPSGLDFSRVGSFK